MMILTLNHKLYGIHQNFERVCQKFQNALRSEGIECRMLNNCPPVALIEDFPWSGVQEPNSCLGLNSTNTRYSGPHSKISQSSF